MTKTYNVTKVGMTEQLASTLKLENNTKNIYKTKMFISIIFSSKLLMMLLAGFYFYKYFYVFK